MQVNNRKVLTHRLSFYLKPRTTLTAHILDDERCLVFSIQVRTESCPRNGIGIGKCSHRSHMMQPQAMFGHNGLSIRRGGSIKWQHWPLEQTFAPMGEKCAFEYVLLADD